MTRQRLAALIVSIAVLPFAPAYADDAKNGDDTVVAKKSLTELRADLYKSEEAFYELFNELNDDEDYDVDCFYERSTGTRIKNHVCRAKFVSDAFTAHAARNRGSVSRVANQSANPEFAKKSAIFEEKLGAAVASSPELQAALEKYNTARAQFATKRDNSGKH